MKTLKHFVIPLASTVFIFSLQTAYARPSLRTLRSNAHNEERVRRATYAPKPEEYAVFVNELLGFSVQYPRGWKTSYVTAESLADEIVHFAPEKYPKSALSVWVKEKGKRLSFRDLQSDLARFARQPINDYQLETMSYIHELKNLRSSRFRVHGKTVLLSTFEAGGISNPHRYKQVRVAAGTKIYVLSFAAPAEYYDSEVKRFEKFIESFKGF
ncbi:hypothetical protein COU76_05010 [Candidatus Peregrinibacteria bacterium CG10_big_fil_rev_8_21_14_0_10_49_10]|nr:MAG: hypothetical protein COU76_05010 [Candidatus Peregrinibacteria bacterium CG10_big_fil_rev_8_21_14_0_10_49_10]